MAGLDEADISQPVGQDTPEILDAGGIAVDDDTEEPPGKMLRIGPAGELQRLRLVRVLAMGRGRVGVAAIGADQAVDHQLQHARRLIPIDWRQDHDAVGRRPARVDVRHPVADLAQRVIGIAAAGPMAEGHGGRHAGLAGIDGPAALGGEPAQIEKINLETGDPLDNLLRHRRETIGLRHLAGAGLVAARRAVDHQDARRRFRVFLPLLRLFDAAFGLDPFERQLIARIGIAGTSRTGARALTRLVIGLPGDIDNLVDRRAYFFECRVVELLAHPLSEFGLVDLDRRHALADINLSHGALPLCSADCGEMAPAILTRRSAPAHQAASRFGESTGALERCNYPHQDTFQTYEVPVRARPGAAADRDRRFTQLPGPLALFALGAARCRRGARTGRHRAQNGAAQP